MWEFASELLFAGDFAESAALVGPYVRRGLQPLKQGIAGDYVDLVTTSHPRRVSVYGNHHTGEIVRLPARGKSNPEEVAAFLRMVNESELHNDLDLALRVFHWAPDAPTVLATRADFELHDLLLANWQGKAVYGALNMTTAWHPPVHKDNLVVFFVHHQATSVVQRWRVDAAGASSDVVGHARPRAY